MRLTVAWVAVVLALGLAWGDRALEVVTPLASAGPGWETPLGRDHLGRDVLARLVVGAWSFVAPGALACAAALGLGVPVGAAAGWFGGLVATAQRALTASVESVPTLALVCLGAAIFGPTPLVLGALAGLAWAPRVAEAVRARLESLRQAELVLALEAHGVPPWRVLGHHLLWVGCRGLLARQALTLFAAVLTLETTLSYLGDLGVAEPTPSWGNMLSFEWGIDGNPWAAAAPALTLWAACAALAWLNEPEARRG
ncbi:ABC transporter permease subunit [Myxococcota bacterium]|nr:ABC transporter permease subunit [Myxococcota bacterium]